MSVKKISEAILGVGVDDTTIDLFESQYPVPTGVSYNSYVILDEKTAVLDTVDARATEPWLENLSEALAGRKPDYLVVSHMEPDHGANIAKLAALYPEMHTLYLTLERVEIRAGHIKLRLRLSQLCRGNEIHGVRYLLSVADARHSILYFLSSRHFCSPADVRRKSSQARRMRARLSSLSTPLAVISLHVPDSLALI